MRDDFSEDVKRTIAARVNYRCTNPSCRAPTSGPQIDASKYLNLGVAAHITAASPGGPRYNPTLTPEERRHANNAIWLCQNCGKLVDNDEARFTEDELRQWKRNAEAEALNQIGKAATAADPAHLDFSEEELMVLISCSDRGEIFLRSSDQIGQWIQVGHQQFYDLADPAVATFYLDALNSLSQRGLVKHDGEDFYRLTGRGFRVARALKRLQTPKLLTTIFPYSIASTLRSIGETFVGRDEELRRIHEVLAPKPSERSAGSSAIFVVEGIAGIGKTQLLKEYSLRFGSIYEGGIFWVQANTSENHLLTQHLEILRALDLTVRDDWRESSAITRALEAALAKRCSKSNVLVVIDDVPEPTGNQRPYGVTHWLPVPPGTPILVSSRVRLSLHERSIEGIFLKPLSRSDAILLLRSGISLPQVTENEWGRIADWVAYHPLALELINRLLVLQAATVEEILGAVQAESPVEALQSRQSLLDGVLPTDCPPGLYGTFEQSYVRLPLEAQQLARTISFLAPAPIPVRLLNEVGPAYAPQNARAVLASRSIISSINETSGASVGFMHPLVAEFVRSQGRDDTELLTALACAVSKQIRALDLKPSAQQIPVEEQVSTHYLAHAEHLFWIIIQTNESLISKMSFMPISETGTFFMVLLLFVAENEERGESAVPRLWLIEQALDIGEALSERLIHIGALDRAVRIQTTVAEYRVKIRGEKSRRSVVTLDHLGLRLSEAQLFEEAINAHEQAIRLAKDAFGEGDRDLIIALDNLGCTLRSSGRSERAVDYHLRALNMAQKHLGIMDDDAVVCASNLVLTALTLIVNSVQLPTSLSDTLKEIDNLITQRLVDNKIPEECLTLAHNLASIYLYVGDFAEGERLTRAVVSGREMAHGRGSVEHLNSLNQLATFFIARGELAEAYSILSEALSLSEEFLGQTHFFSLQLSTNLAEILRRAGKLKEAHERLQAALHACSESLPPSHPLFQSIKWNLALVLLDLGFEDQAETLLGRPLGKNAHSSPSPNSMTDISENNSNENK